MGRARFLRSGPSTGPSITLAARYWSSSPRAQVQGEGLQTPQPMKNLRSYYVTGTVLNILHPASFHSPSNWTLLAPKVASRKLNHVSKVTWMELELKLVCVQSVSSDLGDTLCIQEPPQAEYGRARNQAYLCLIRERLRLSK